MKEDDKIPELSLLGGPLQWLGCRLGLVREGTNTSWLGMALGLLAWGVLMLLAPLQGLGLKMFSLALIGGHVRLLVAVPLFFVCETWVVPRMAEFVRGIVSSGLVPDAELPALQSDIRRVGRIKDSWLAEVLFLLLAFTWPLIETVADLPGRTGNWASILAQAGGRLTLINGWYLMFCLPLFRFLMLRWLWHLSLWWYFLWRVKKLDLHLIPTHPDSAGGLGYLEVVQEHFTPLAAAISAVFSASFAEGIFSETMGSRGPEAHDGTCGVRDRATAAAVLPEVSGGPTGGTIISDAHRAVGKECRAAVAGGEIHLLSRRKVLCREISSID